MGSTPTPGTAIIEFLSDSLFARHRLLTGCQYTLPGADLSFAYGEFLGVTRSGEVALLDAQRDVVFSELEQLINRDERVAGLSKAEQVDLLQAAVEVAFDPDASGAGYVITGTPGCPACGGRSVASSVETARTAYDGTVPPMTSTRWSALSAEEREGLVRGFLDRSLDGA